MSKKQVTEFTSSAVFEAEAALENPNVGWLEFVLTDNKPNANKQGIPAEAFANLIKSGLHMPIKVAQGEVKLDHSDASPLGPIVELKEQGEAIDGKAVIWKKERPNDYKMLRAMSKDGESIDISWEVGYTESSVDEDEIEWLDDPVLRAATIVGCPAYGGRTPVTSVASEYPESEAGLEEAAKWTTKYISALPDSAFLYIESGGSKDGEGKTTPTGLRHLPYKNAEGSIDCPHLKNATSRATQIDLPKETQLRLKSKAQKLYQENCANTEESNMEIEELENKLDELEAKLEEQTTSNEELQASNEELLAEKAELEKYKELREQEDAEAALLEERLEMLADAGIELTDEELKEKREMFLELSEEAFGSMVEMMKEVRSAAASVSQQVPDLSPDADTKDLVKIVRKGLKELDNEE